MVSHRVVYSATSLAGAQPVVVTLPGTGPGGTGRTLGGAVGRVPVWYVGHERLAVMFDAPDEIRDGGWDVHDLVLGEHVADTVAGLGRLMGSVVVRGSRHAPAVPRVVSAKRRHLQR
jgi:hypothetical protein